MATLPGLAGMQPTASPYTRNSTGQIGLQGMSTPLGGWGGVSGIQQSGNTQLYNRPRVPNNWADPTGIDILPTRPNGDYSTVRSMTFLPEENGPAVLIPQVADGKYMNRQQAIDYYKRTGQKMGQFDTPDQADVYAIQYHKDAEEGKYNSPRGLHLQLPTALDPN